MKDIFIVYEMADGTVAVAQQAAEDRRLKDGAFFVDADGNIQSLAGTPIPKRASETQVGEMVGRNLAENDDEATQRFVQRAWPRDAEGRALAKRYAIVGRDALPTSRTFRNAWRLRDGKVVVDLDAAKAECTRMAAPLVAASLDRIAKEATVATLLDDAEKLEAAKAKARHVRDLGTVDLAGVRTVADLEIVWAQVRADLGG